MLKLLLACRVDFSEADPEVTGVLSFKRRSLRSGSRYTCCATPNLIARVPSARRWRGSHAALASSVASSCSAG